MSDPDHLFHKTTFLRDWMIATTLGLILGNLMSWYIPRLALVGAKGLEHALAMIIPHQGLGAVMLTIPSYLVTTTSVGTIIALCLCLTQWVVLRKWKVSWAREWLVAGGIGAVLSYLLMASLNILAILLDPDPRLLKGMADSGLWIGAIVGGAQWQVLRKYSAQAKWWVLVSAGIWGTGSILNRLVGQKAANVMGSLLAELLQMEFGGKSAIVLRPFVMGEMVLWIIAGVVSGLVTWKMLGWLMKNQLES